MDTHVRVLAMLFVIFGVLGILASIAVFVLGAGVTATILSQGQDADARVGAAWAGGCLTFAAVAVAALSIPNIINGWGLWRRKSWSRILTIILAVLHLPGFPIGTAIGIYALVVMLNEETRRLLTA